MSTDAQPAPRTMATDPDLIQAVDILESVSDCRQADGTVVCPICGDTAASLTGLTNHASNLHERPVIEELLGTDQWRWVLEVCRSEHGMSPRRIADYLPDHTGYWTVQNGIERFDLPEPATDYGQGEARHPDDPVEQVVRETWHAAQVYLSSPTISTFLAKSLVEDVDASHDLVSKALMELKSRGKMTVVNSTSPHRWALAEDGGENSE